MSITGGSLHGMCPGFFDGVDNFLDTPVRPEDMREILGAASYAPSIANSQSWEFIVTTSTQGKSEMAKSLLDVQFRPRAPQEADAPWFVQAPVILTVLMNRLRAKAKIGPEGADRFALMDIGMAVACLFQAGRRIGIGGTIIREFDRSSIAHLFSLPSHLDPLLLVALGYTAEVPRGRPRLHLDEYVHWEFDGPGAGA